MMQRREVLRAAAGAGIGAVLSARSGRTRADAPTAPTTATAPSIIDTNVHLFRWPFRHLPLEDTGALVKQLRALGVGEAWAGSFSAILHRDLGEVNRRLADACRQSNLLVPVGAVNVTLPNWQHDVRACFEQHQMPGLRLYPNYHGYTLEDPRFVQLIGLATEAGRFVQIAKTMEDRRTQASQLMVPDVDLMPLPKVMRRFRGARVQILNERPRGPFVEMVKQTAGVFLDTARVDSTDGVPKLVKQLPPGRVLFGSHAPFLIPQAALIRTHESSLLDDAELRDVLLDNARTFSTPQAGGEGESQRESQGEATAAFQPGLPAEPLLASYRIWDSYFTPAHSHPGPDGQSRLRADMVRALPAIRAAKMEKLCYFPHVGLGTTSDPALETLLQTKPQLITKPLEDFPEQLIGMIQVNAHDVRASLDAINRWLRDGPMLGVYFPGGGPGALACSHRNMNPLIERIADLQGVMMQHTWFNSLGKQSPGASTPAELAVVAKRFPQQKFLCAHAGGEWEQGIRAVRDQENILVETSGFDATAGFIEMAVRALGAERIVFGSHLPSRSLGTELGKVIAARITEKEKRLILGENYRRLLRLSDKR